MFYCIITIILALGIFILVPLGRVQAAAPLTEQSQALFRQVFGYAEQLGFVAGFPNFNTFDYNDGRGRIWNSILLPSTSAVWLDVPASQLNMSGPGPLFRSVHGYAVAHGYV